MIGPSPQSSLWCFVASSTHYPPLPIPPLKRKEKQTPFVVQTVCNSKQKKEGGQNNVILHDENKTDSLSLSLARSLVRSFARSLKISLSLSLSLSIFLSLKNNSFLFISPTPSSVSEKKKEEREREKKKKKKKKSRVQLPTDERDQQISPPEPGIEQYHNLGCQGCRRPSHSHHHPQAYVYKRQGGVGEGGGGGGAM